MKLRLITDLDSYVRLLWYGYVVICECNSFSSDIDLGIYYHPGDPLNLDQLRDVAVNLDDEHRPDVITEPGGWGPWINGGGWLKVQSHPRSCNTLLDT